MALTLHAGPSVVLQEWTRQRAPPTASLLAGNRQFLHLALQQSRALGSLARRIGIVKDVILGVYPQQIALPDPSPVPHWSAGKRDLDMELRMGETADIHRRVDYSQTPQ
jgi:hypothetical protein